MKVCIDCSPLLVRSAGVKTYLYHWLNALRRSEPESIVTFLEPRGSTLEHDAGPNLHLLPLALLWALNHSGDAMVSRCFPASSVIHVSNLLRRFPKGRKLSATIHDLTAWVVPQFHTATQRAADRTFAANVWRPADGLICVSENSRQDASRILGIHPRKMTVIWPGVPDSYFNAGTSEARAAAQVLQLPSSYLLYIGTIEPRKNVDGLLTAWFSLPADLRRDHTLIVAGMPGWNAENTLQRLRHTARPGSGVRYLGYVPETLMPGLTAGARALIYPSFYEGFGIPVAQALAAGCPVITSGISSLPEIAGDAALFVEPHSPGEIATAIRRLCESDADCERLRSAGRERAKLFSWGRAARESLEYFRNLT